MKAKCTIYFEHELDLEIKYVDRVRSWIDSLTDMNLVFKNSALTDATELVQQGLRDLIEEMEYTTAENQLRNTFGHLPAFSIERLEVE